MLRFGCYQHNTSRFTGDFMMFIMGCAISLGQHKIVDLNNLGLNGSKSVELISSPLQLINYFREDNNLPKCIFIFGGSGSNKGEFIYEMICASWTNYRNEQMYEYQQACQKKLVKEQTDAKLASSTSRENPKSPGYLNVTNEKEPTQNQFIQSSKTNAQTRPQIVLVNRMKSQESYRSFSVSNQLHHRLWNNSNCSSFSNASIRYEDNLNFVYSYIDIERLILENLNCRISELGGHGTFADKDIFASNKDLNEAEFERKTEGKKSQKIDFDKIVKQKTDMNDKQNENDPHKIRDRLDILSDQKEDQKVDDRSKNISPACVHQNSDDLTSSNKSKDKLGIKSEKQEKTKQNEQNEKDENKKNRQKGIAENSLENGQMHLLTKDVKKSKKRLHNSHWAEFLTACEEDFEYNQSKINTNYNLRKLKDRMFVYANCVTNNWVFSLIENEIEKRNQSLRERFKELIEREGSKEKGVASCEDDEKQKSGQMKNGASTKRKDKYRNCLSLKRSKEPDLDVVLPETIYIISLVPNLINIFKHCLFLQQSPNLNSFGVNFIAINLISGDLGKKDLDSVVSHSLQDELNYNYMNYFRSINRLTEVELNEKKQKIRIRLTKSKQAIKISSESDVQILFGALEDNQEIDLSEFECKREQDALMSEKKLMDKTERGNLLFFLDQVVDIGDLLLYVEDQSLKMSKLRRFIQAYLRQKEKSLIARRTLE